ncbi:hypothetical protein RDI58_026958 [Solanum bulbocastanum]|uniref:Uncharacterized protein n=1 Tax=Solanum bulbocastanum TaxID=147425 RepID=A0AAN8SXB8_SOLBU
MAARWVRRYLTRLVVTLLCQIPEGSNHNASAATVGIIKLLIGQFDLDPNRVFDIVRSLSIMISFWSVLNISLVNSIFLDLIPIFPKSHASQILGFKFQYYQHLKVNDLVPSELYQLTALLVKRDFIDVDSMRVYLYTCYAHLLPTEDAAFDHYNAFSAKRLDEVPTFSSANKIGRIIVAATGKDLMDEEKQGDVTVDLYAAFDMETEAVAERSSELENSQPLGLLMGFLEVDDWGGEWLFLLHWVEHYEKDAKAAMAGLLNMMLEDVFESSMRDITIAMMRNYPQLMRKFMSDKAKIPYLLELIVHMNLELYSLKRQD